LSRDVDKISICFPRWPHRSPQANAASSRVDRASRGHAPSYAVPSLLYSTSSPWRTATCCLRRIVVTHISARLRTIHRLRLVPRPPKSQQPVVVGRLTGIESQTRGVERVPGRPGLCISKTPVTPRTIRGAARFRAAKQFRIAAVPHDCHCLIYPCCPILGGSRGGLPSDRSRCDGRVPLQVGFDCAAWGPCF
jgi:hypothetical protein